MTRCVQIIPDSCSLHRFPADPVAGSEQHQELRRPGVGGGRAGGAVDLLQQHREDQGHRSVEET